MNLKKLKDSYEKIKAWDLQKAFPNYFNKTYFRIGFIFLFIYVILMLSQTWGTWSYAYYECTDSACINPFYACKDYNGEDITDEASSLKCYTKTSQELCDKGLCDTKYLKYGESLGQKPPFSIVFFPKFLVFILSLMFIFNHISAVGGHIK